jgi:hypothetical protein
MANLQTLKMAGQLAQANAAASSAGLDVPSLLSKGQALLTDPLAACRDNGNVDQDLDDKRDDDAPVIAVPMDAGMKYQLRLCVYAGENLSRATSYPLICLNEGKANEKKIQGEPVADTTHPVWEFVLEEEIEYDGSPPAVEIQILGQGLLSGLSIVGDSKLGAVSLQLPNQPMDVPVRKKLLVKNAPKSVFPGFETGKPKLQVVYQVCESLEGQPDLLRIAELDADASDVKKYTAQVRLTGVQLKRSTEKKQT